MQNLRAGDLAIDVADEAGKPIRLSWTGKSNERYPGRTLTPLLTTAMDEAARRAQPLELRFERLEDLNSATAAVLIQTIQEARARGVRLGLVYDPRRKALKASFEALRVFVKGDDLLRIVPVA